MAISLFVVCVAFLFGWVLGKGVDNVSRRLERMVPDLWFGTLPAPCHRLDSLCAPVPLLTLICADEVLGIPVWSEEWNIPELAEPSATVHVGRALPALVAPIAPPAPLAHLDATEPICSPCSAYPGESDCAAWIWDRVPGELVSQDEATSPALPIPVIAPPVAPSAAPILWRVLKNGSGRYPWQVLKGSEVVASAATEESARKRLRAEQRKAS